MKQELHRMLTIRSGTMVFIDEVTMLEATARYANHIGQESMLSSSREMQRDVPCREPRRIMLVSLADELALMGKTFPQNRAIGTERRRECGGETQKLPL
jgi:hypothetical protein